MVQVVLFLEFLFFKKNFLTRFFFIFDMPVIIFIHFCIATDAKLHFPSV